MHEDVTRALVLSEEPSGELDARYVLFTERLGKVRARAKSTKKPTSKLVGHLQPGTFASVRLVETKGVQLVDALKLQAGRIPLPDLYYLEQLLPEGVPEPVLWKMLVKGELVWTAALRALGWDPAAATCTSCRRARPNVFHIGRQEFFCAACASRFGPDAVLLKY
ncbi:MAG TPA: recombination protein O N-terminal domain-containing protein [Candidatus Paceibacterota bacterium]|nr:recombination protein O N-terminal domain-containing protein [Candidatus Paceibacterota bacterium]